MNDFNSCVKICAFTVQNMCDIDDPTHDLKEDCAQACGDLSEYTGGNSTVLGLELIKERGCDRYVRPKKPVYHRISTEEMVAFGILAVGVLVFLAIGPKPVLV